MYSVVEVLATVRAVTASTKLLRRQLKRQVQPVSLSADVEMLEGTDDPAEYEVMELLGHDLEQVCVTDRSSAW